MSGRFFRIESDLHTRIIAELNSKALVNNYKAIQAQVPEQAILPMVKANGYGHGADWAAKELLSMPNLYGFGVATMEEGRALRVALGAKGRKTKILIFSGAAPWNEEKGQFCERFRLIPVIHEDQDWFKFIKDKWPEKLSYELKFNTGMNRLGMSLSLAGSVVKALRSKPASWQPIGIISHLAQGESPNSPLSCTQREGFIALRKVLNGAFPASLFHLANSAGIWNSKLWGLSELTDIVRPGLSLYGITPWDGAPARGLVPVMTIKARIMARHRLRPGECVGYGATYMVPRGPAQQAVDIAILGAGYADGVHRALSNKGKVWIGGELQSVLGVISMDLCAVGCSSKTKVGEWAQVLGLHVDPWAQARSAGTIPYELLTSVSGRVQRVYE